MLNVVQSCVAGCEGVRKSHSKDKWQPDGEGAGINHFVCVQLWLLGINPEFFSIFYWRLVWIPIFQFQNHVAGSHSVPTFPSSAPHSRNVQNPPLQMHFFQLYCKKYVYNAALHVKYMKYSI